MIVRPRPKAMHDLQIRNNIWLHEIWCHGMDHKDKDSGVAMPCGCYWSLHIIPDVLDGFQKVRDYINRPIHFSCLSRCPVHNARVGGKEESDHLWGGAGDVFTEEMEPVEFGPILWKVGGFRAVGIYQERGFCHAGIRAWGKHPSKWGDWQEGT